MQETDDKIIVKNPATGSIVGEVVRGRAEDVRDAVDTALLSSDLWAMKKPVERGKILFKSAAAVRARQNDLARLLTSEQGKPLAEAKNEIQGFANILEFYASVSGTISGSSLPKSDYGYAFTKKEPLGVCGAIIPWNMPAIIMGWKVGPALAAGNTLVLKPASSTPLTNMRLAEIMNESGLPEGVLNIVCGSGKEAGAEIVRNKKISAVSFTGSAETGIEVSKLAAGTFKKMTLELGGSDPMVVCSDADIDLAVSGAVSGRFYNCGQTCTAVKRLYVFEDVADEFISKLKEKTEKMTIGDGSAKGTRMGPLHSREGRDGITDVISETVDKGKAEVLTGGYIPTGEDFDAGNFLMPTVLTGVSPDSRVLNEEIFGPVLPVMTVSGMDEAVIEANKTRFGLGASVWTKSIKNASDFAESVDAGIVWVNRHLKVPPEIPFGGEKSSGTGRENGLFALERYMKEKTVIVSP
ncbi:aldehyde dehydrogenase [Methanoplanus sp. FWC-SCC4]|uniref:Aldehyde dehydrogenase n=1 Tax=Methanochimaera problematica TaxID=2609417 RepID=A0AA97FAA4_9EURY|nr:aldehyde dehydrogenase family protein [Methanoplanus sp. FWC-SCC4]WOF15279.1 aldehyde dehydrogenase [Methanoplanus sp. FWC-SCC4]